MSPDDPQIPIGSRWKERDRRFTRYVIVKGIEKRFDTFVVVIESERFGRRTEVRHSRFLTAFDPAPRPDRTP